MNKMNKVKKTYSRLVCMSVLGLSGATCLSSTAFASGYALREGSADWLGNAFVGGEAKAYDAGTAWSNPAGMTRLDQDEIDQSINYIAPAVKFQGTNTNPATGGNVSGTVGKNNIQSGIDAAGSGVFVLSPNWRFGVALGGPFGNRMAYPSDFVGRYQSLVSSVTDLNLGLSLAYKVNDHLSIGGGPNIDYFVARLTQALNIPVLSAATGQDPTTNLYGNQFGAGYNLGALYQLDDDTRIGIDYRSRIHHNLTPEVTVSVPGIYSVLSPATAAALNAGSGEAKVSITLPDNLSTGIYHQISPQWAVMASLQWTDWSLFNSLNVEPVNGQPALRLPMRFHNTWFAGVGTNYQPIDKLTLQGGFSYDQSPVDNSNRTTRLPDASHYVLGAGAKYQVTRNTTLDVAYAHIFTPGGTINNAAPSPTGLAGVISGTYKVSGDTLAIGVATKF